jgi:2-oxoglutarate dehydrogenase E2 component (dihydrolipoamide succinyltransferase)
LNALIEVRVPLDQVEGTQSVLQTWLKAAGDHVRVNEPLAELETDKVVVEVASPADGILQELLKAPGEEVAPGDLLAQLLPAAKSLDTEEFPDPIQGRAEAPDQEARTRRGRTSPAVRRLLLEHGLREDAVRGSGKDGRVTARDIESMLGAGPSGLQAGAKPRSHLMPVDNMRKRIAEHMVRSVQTAPHVTTVFEADLSAVLAHRAAQAANPAGGRLTLTAYFIAASAIAMGEVPAVNSRWQGDHLEVFDDINIGIGTALEDRGLVVPVMRRVQALNLGQIAQRLEDMTARAREGRLTPADVQDGTFTISNHGVSGSLIASPIVINQPQSAILGVGKLEKRVIVRELDGQDSIQIRPMCFITLTLDHRVLDGYQANRFLGRLVSVLEHWPADCGLDIPI